MTEIIMVGIDHNKAPIEEREKFSFTKAGAKEALEILKKEKGVSGSLLLSTCNRTELWLTGDANAQELMEKIAGTTSSHFIERRGEDAMGHLFRLACGLESQLTGEDQILSQIKDALTLAQSCHSGDTVMDRTFRCAISAAKKVKSNVRLTSISPSAARSSVRLMEEKLGDLRDVPCLIIGNGQIGKLLAEELLHRGAKVSMTLRKRIHGKEIQNSVIPKGCTMIPYEERMAHLKDYRCVVSGTMSPHFTVKAADLEHAGIQGEQLYLDLAVPRDMEAAIGDIPGIELYNMDQISAAVEADGGETGREQAEAILQEAMDELRSQLAFEDHLPRVERISQLVKDDVNGRMKTQDPDAAAEKSIRKLLFGLRKHLSEEDWESCFSALEKAARDDTIKTGEKHHYEED